MSKKELTPTQRAAKERERREVRRFLRFGERMHHDWLTRRLPWRTAG